MKRFFSFLIAASLFFVLASSRDARAQSMTDYCQVPPYVIQNVPANVMIILDNSGSMHNFAYSDGFNTVTTADDNGCANSASPCSGFTSPGTYPTFKYYGYFNPDHWYTYTSNRFITDDTAVKVGSGLPGERAKAANEWDGNFLNWLIMRRIDVLRKVLTGGKEESGEGVNFDRLVAERADDPSRGIYKLADTTGLADDAYSGTRCITFNSSATAGVTIFTVRSGSNCGSAAVASFDGKARVPTPVEGVVQEVSTKVRLGLMFFNTDEGGFVQVPIFGTSLNAIVNQINNTRPSTWTPLAETLWTATGFFAQQASMLGGPGPRYHSGDYQINNNNDPFNYGTGGSPRYPPCSKNFILLLTDGEPTMDGNMPASVLNYASGRSIFDCTGTSCPATSGGSFSFPATTLTGSGTTHGVEDVALYIHTNDLRSTITGTQNLTLYPVMAFGKGSTILRYAAINGGFEDSNGNNQPDIQSEWDKYLTGQPDNYYEAWDGAELEAALKSAFSDMITRVASGTAAAVLASGEGSGANLVQASFYPRRRFGNDVITWAGGLQNLWYYLSGPNMREDTLQDKKLNLQDDYVMQFYFDTTTQTTRAARWQDATGTGAPLTPASTVTFENVKNIWDAGAVLWGRDLVTDPRSIYTAVTGTTLLPFTTANAATLAPYLNVTDLDLSGSTTNEAENVIKWARGEDLTLDVVPSGAPDGINDFRARLVTMGTGTNVWKLGDILNSTPKIASWVPLNPYWSLTNPATKQRVYADSTYDNDTGGLPAFLKTVNYTERGVVYVGANDGMLHAFRLGIVEPKWTVPPDPGPAQGQFDQVRLINPETGLVCGDASETPSQACGKELWAFIPKNVLPYLKFIPDPDYCHVYTVDLVPVLVDASINKPVSCAGGTNYWDCVKDETSWSTILIGGMRQGGACKNMGATCTGGGTDCVKTPVVNNGYSSYFALDVTDQNNPKLLWEKSEAELPGLGFATSGPAVLRISAKDAGTGAADETKNGRWFVVLGSGPTGPIDSATNQFLGRSDQNMKLFVLDLKDGSLLRTIDTGIQNAFAGSLYHSTHDTNWANIGEGKYQDDTVYVPYTKLDNTTWTRGGVGNLLTTVKTGSDIKESLNPNDWVWRIIIDNIGPVTSGVQNLDDGSNANSYVFFGTGRYYFAQGSALDDQHSQRRLYGMKHPCAVSITGSNPPSMMIDPTCVAMVNVGALTNVTANGSWPSQGDANLALSMPGSVPGWYVNLDESSQTHGTYSYPPDVPRTFGAERNITDPFSSVSGCVYFTTYKPYADECALGGKTFIWLLNYNNGAPPGDEESMCQLQGSVMMQLSTGAIEQKDIKTALTDNSGRRSSAMEGEPPRGPAIVVINPPAPVKRILQIKER